MKKSLFLTAALALLAFLAIPMGMWGQTRSEVTYTFSDHFNSNSTELSGLSFDDVITGSFAKGNGSTQPQYYTNGSAVRWYGNNTLEIIASNATISSIEITYTQKNKEVTADVGTYNHATGTWTGSASSVTFTVESGTGHNRVSALKVNYTISGGNASVATPTINPNGDIFLESQEVSISCATEGATIYYTTNGNDPTTSSSIYSAPFTITATTTVKAFAVKSGYDNSAIATATFTKTTPMTVAEARTFIDGLNGGTSDDVCVSGIISQIDQYHSNYHSITYWISDDGTTTDQLEVYSGKGLDGADFNSIEDLVLQSEVIVKGKLKKYNDIYEFNQTSQIVSLVPPTIVVATPVFNPNGGTFTEAQTVTNTCATEGTTIYYTTDGSEPDDESTEYEGPFTVNETMTIKAKAYDAQDHESAVATATFTINLPYSGPAYARVDNVSYLTDGARVILAARYDTDHAMGYYAMPNTTSGQLEGVLFTSTTSNGFEVLPATILNAENSYYWTVNITNNGYTFTNANGTVLGWNSSTNFASGGDNTVWTVEEGTTGSEAMVPNYTAFRITNVGSTSTNTTRAIAMNGNHKFGPYAISNNNGATYNFSIDIFVQGAEPVPTPSIVANNVEIEYDATSGAVTYTINNPAGGVLTAATAAEWLTLGTVGETVPFTCSANTGVLRTATITLTYTYNRATVTKDVTVTQAGNPNVVNNISDITEVGSSYTVRGTVVAINNKGFVMGDGTGYVYTYLNATPTVAVDDMVTVSGTTATYGHIIQFNNTATIDEATSSNYNGTPAATVITEVPDYTEGYHLSDYLEYEGTLTKSSSNYLITLGEAQIQISYPTTAQGTALTALNGKTVHVKGYFTGINSSGKFTTMLESVEEVISTVPVINANNVTLAYDATSGEIPYTITNPVTGTVLNATTQADWISGITVNDSTVVFTTTVNEGDADRTATFTLSYTGANDKEVTVTQGYYIPDFATLPFDFDGGKADIETTAGLTQNGLDSDYGSSPKLKFNTAGDWLLLHFIEAPGQLSFDIKGNPSQGSWGGTFTVQTSEDGETFTDLATYTDLTTTVLPEEFNNLNQNVRYIKWIYTEKVSGNVALGNIHLYKYGSGPASITVAPATVNATAAETEGTLTVTYTNITNIVAEVFFCNAEGEAEEYDWIFADIDNDNNIEYLIDANPANARTAYLKVYALDDDAHEVYSNLVTINQAEYEAPFTGTRYGMITTTANIESGRHYIIAGWKDNQAYAMGLQNGNNRAAVAINIDDDGWAYVDSSDVYEFVINGPDADGNYFFYDTNEASTGYLYAASSGSNHLKTDDFLDALGNGLWSIEIAEIGNAATVIAQGDHERNWMRFNSNNNPPIFSCYGSTSNQKDIYLFMKEEDENFEFFKDIVGFGNGNGDWHLVSTPFDDVEPVDANMEAEEDEDYDLYWFNPTATGEEWRNYKTAPFNLYMGKGYLYASKNPVTLHFEGDGILGVGSEEVPLEYEGFNLVGNPFARLATVDVEDFYVMSDGYEIAIADRDYVKPMEGIFVEAATQGQSVTFSSLEVGVGGNEPDQQNKLNIRVTDNNGNSDIARIRFGEGRGLEKLMLNENHNKLYFVVDGNEYAVTYAANKGEMSVYFKAAEDGTYTLTVSATLNSRLSTLNFKYLHLIDNLTGAEVDLLANPTYTFQAKTSDNSNRFLLVFSAAE